MPKLIFSEKLRRTTRFAVKTISNIAVVSFASKAVLIYGSAVIKQASHIVLTDGKVWNPSTIIEFEKKD